MGWKCSAVMARREGAANAAPAPDHDPGLAGQLLAMLGYSGFIRTEEVPLSEGVYPSSENEVIITAGSASGVTMVGDLRGGNDGMVVGHAAYPLLRKVIALNPHGVVMALELHSVVNWWGVALYERGQCVRAYAGCPDDGIVIDEGRPIPEEAMIASAIEDITSDGEELVLTLVRRVLGARLDDAGMEAWSATRFARASPKRAWWKLW